MKKISLIFVVLLNIALLSCEKNSQPNSLPDDFGNGILILNEGNFNYSNASVDFVDERDSVYKSVFWSRNGFMLGDILQSGLVDGNYVLLVVNNSGKIVLARKKDLQYLTTITGFTSPRYVLRAGDKYFVTDLYGTGIYVVDTASKEVVSVINTGHSTEEIILSGEYLYAVSWRDDSLVLKIDPTEQKVVSQVVVGYQPNSIETDKNGYLWVLCDGGVNPDLDKDSIPCLAQIDPLSMQIVKRINFPAKEMSPTDLEINNTGDTLYYLNSSWTAGSSGFGVYRMSIYGGQLPSIAFIPQEDKLFYFLKVDKERNILYVGDAKDFISGGSVLKYDNSGKLFRQYQAGVIPGDLLFLR